MWITKPDFVSIVIPTMARPTLKRSIQSLLDQNDWNWRGIIVFDGGRIPPDITGLNPDINYKTDNHFIVLTPNTNGHAGLVRNEGIKVADTEWIGFLDDDDYLDNTYVSTLKTYSNDYDVVIFSYKDIKTGNVQPPQNSDKDFHVCNVGISFAVRASFIREHNILFDAFSIEDYRFLDNCRSAGARYIVTHQIKYLVGGISGWRE